LSVAVSTSTETPRKRHRPRRERLMRKDIPRAPSFHATRTLEECYPRLFMHGFRVKLSDLIRKNIKILDRAAFTPIGWEGCAFLLQVYVGKLFGSKYNGNWILMSGTPHEDRRLRPKGLSVAELITLTMMNYYRVGDRLAALKKAGWVRAWQPRKAVDKADRRWEGLANQIEIPWATIEALGMSRADVEAELEQEEAERLASKKAQAQLEGTQRALDQQDARDRRGQDHPLVSARKTREQRKAEGRVMEYERDEQGRRMPTTPEERLRWSEISCSPDLKDLPSDQRREQSLARWRKELLGAVGPPD